MILNWITDQEDRLLALHVLPVQRIFCSSRSEFGESFTVNLQMSPAGGETDGDRRQEPVSPLFGSLISTLLGEQPFAPTRELNNHLKVSSRSISNRGLTRS